MTQEPTPLEKHIATYGLTQLDQAANVVGMRIYTVNTWEFTLQEGDGHTFTYANDAQGIGKAWGFLTLVCEELNKSHPLGRGPRVLPERRKDQEGQDESELDLPSIIHNPNRTRKYQRCAIHTARLEDIDMLFDMTADWLRGFDGDQPEAFAALRYLHNTLFPERMAFCEDCGGSNAGVGVHTEVHTGERSQCFTCFKVSYLQAYSIPWPWPFYPGCCDECGKNTDLVQVGTGVLCKKCKQDQEGASTWKS